MLTRNQFLFMLLLAIIGTAFAYYAQKLIHWSDALEWFKKIQVYDFLCAVAIVLVFIFSIWINDIICRWITEKEQKRLFEIERRELVAEKIRLRKEKADVY